MCPNFVVLIVSNNKASEEIMREYCRAVGPVPLSRMEVHGELIFTIGKETTFAAQATMQRLNDAMNSSHQVPTLDQPLITYIKDMFTADKNNPDVNAEALSEFLDQHEDEMITYVLA